MQKVKWYRKGEWLENNALVVSGYDLNEHGAFVEREGASTMIAGVDFNGFACLDTDAKKIGDKHVEFSIGDKTYLADTSLYNAFFSLADDVLADIVDTICDKFDINQGESLDLDEFESPRPALSIV